MIIVKTSKGNVFLNDKNTEIIEHDKPAEQVSVKFAQTPSFYNYYDVGSVRYISDAQAIDYKDEGNELENLRTRIGLLSKLAERRKELASTLRHLYICGLRILESISEIEDPNTYDWQDILKEVKKHIDFVYKTLEKDVKPTSVEINTIENDLENVTTDGSV